MNPFDRTARQASKVNAGPFFAWLLSHFQPPPPLVFERWDDTRRSSWEGGPDRTNDLLAQLRRTDQAGRLAYLLVEFQSEPEKHMLQRLGVYELLLSREIAPEDEAGSEVAVGSILVHLTGEEATPRLVLGVPGTGKGTRVEPLIVNLYKDDAAATLADMVAGRTGLCVLPWVPLMKGAGQPALIAEWKRVAMTEPDPHNRAQHREVALVFAELSKELVNWQKGLEGWEMLESQVINGWINRGRISGILEARRADVLRILSLRLHGPVPEPIRLAVEGTNDPDTLARWLDAASQAQTWAEFRAAMPIKG
jgi:hypothetical protein